MTTCIDPEAELREEQRLKREGERFISSLKLSKEPPVYRNHEIKCPPTIDTFDECPEADAFLAAVIDEVIPVDC